MAFKDQGMPVEKVPIRSYNWIFDLFNEKATHSPIGSLVLHHQGSFLQKPSAMTKHIPISSMIILGILILTGCNTNLKTSGDIPDWARNTNQQVQEWVDNESILGAELLILKDQKPILHEVYGMDSPDDQKVLEKNQLFRIHSMTKPFTGTAIMMLADEGMISLDDTVATFLDAYKNEKCKNITIRQLMNHTAGFVQPAYPKGPIDLYNSLEEAVTDLASDGPKYTPGESYHYSDGHSATLGLIVTKVSGIPVEQFIEERIFQPLNMNDSYCALKEDQPNREKLCDTYYWHEGKYQKLWDNQEPSSTPFFRASGGILTTAEDYGKFMTLWLDPENQKGVSLLSTSMMKQALKTDSIHPSYGMHWEIYYSPESGDSLPVFGHGGSSGTMAIAIPEENAIIIYMTQSRGTLTGNYLASLVLQQLGYEASKPVRDEPLNDSIFQLYAGNFQVGAEIWSVEKTRKGICLKSPRLVPIEFLPVSDTEFVQPYMDLRVTFPNIGDNNPVETFSFYIGEREVIAKREPTDQ